MITFVMNPQAMKNEFKTSKTSSIIWLSDGIKMEALSIIGFNDSHK
jgi:hypothetical protein